MVDNGVPPPPDGTGDDPDWAKDPKALGEDENWGNESLLKGVQLGNTILWTKIYGIIVAGMMVFFSASFCLALAVWLWHYLTSLPWLSEEQLSKIQSVIFSGSLGAIVTAYAQKHLDRLGSR